LSVQPRPDEYAFGDARRWLTVREAAEVTAVPASTLRRWLRAGRIDSGHEPGSPTSRTLVDVDQILLVRAAQASKPRPAVAESDMPRTTQLLSMLALVTQERATAAEAHSEQLAIRLRELESWVAGNARFDEVEHVQLGRLLAHASAEREEGRRPLLSLRAALLFLYAIAALAFAVLLVVGV